jgi:hypothetical protein
MSSLKYEFVESYDKYFSKENKYAVILEFVETGNDIDKVLDIRKKFTELANLVFLEKKVWVRLIIWDIAKGTKQELVRCGFNERNLNFVY